MGTYGHKHGDLSFEIIINSQTRNDGSKFFSVTIDNHEHKSEIEKGLETAKGRAKDLFERRHTIEIGNPENRSEEELLAFITEQIDQEVQREATVQEEVRKYRAANPNTATPESTEDLTNKTKVIAHEQRQRAGIGNKLQELARQRGFEVDGIQLEKRILDQFPPEIMREEIGKLNSGVKLNATEAPAETPAQLPAEDGPKWEIDQGMLTIRLNTQTLDDKTFSINPVFNLGSDDFVMNTSEADQKRIIGELAKGLQDALQGWTESLRLAELDQGREGGRKFMNALEKELLEPALNHLKEVIPDITLDENSVDRSAAASVSQSFGRQEQTPAPQQQPPSMPSMQ